MGQYADSASEGTRCELRGPPNDALCLQCGYNLRDLQNWRCPECNHPFDPNNAKTFRSRSTSPLLLQWRHAPRWIYVALLLPVSALVIYLCSEIIGIRALLTAQIGNVVFLLLLGYLLVDYSFRAAATIRFRNVSPVYHIRRPFHRTRLAFSTLLVLCIVSAASTEWPLYVRFLASRAAFERTLQADPLPIGTNYIGLFRTSVVRHNDYVVFYTDQEHYGEQRALGFAWCPRQPSDLKLFHPEAQFRHILGDWYFWSSR